MNILTEAELPDDAAQLKLLVVDLSRRLQNTHYILQSEKQLKEELIRQNDFYKFQIKQLIQTFFLEFARMKNFEWKTVQERESVAYEEKKAVHTRNLETLRLMELDNQISGRKKFVPKNILKLRGTIVGMEKQQENQRKFLSFLSQFQQLNEQLVSAIQQNSLQEVLHLLQQGADVNYVDNIGYLPLHYAIIYGHYDLCQLLLMKGADYSTYLTGSSSLVFACQYGHVSILSLLLSYGGNIHEKDRNGVSPIMIALMNYHFHVMEYCVMNGASVLDYDLSTENTLLHTIVLISSAQANQKNLDSHFPSTKLTANNTLQSRRPVTAPSLSLPFSSEQVPVNEIVIRQIIQFLVENGCDIYKLNKLQLNPLQLALQIQNRLCIDALKPYYEDENMLQFQDLPEVGTPTPSVLQGLGNTTQLKKSANGNSNVNVHSADNNQQRLLGKIKTPSISGEKKERLGSKSSRKVISQTKQPIYLSGTLKPSEEKKLLPDVHIKTDGKEEEEEEGNNSVMKPALSKMPSDDNLAIPPSSSYQKSYSSMNLLEKINENWTFQDAVIYPPNQAPRSKTDGDQQEDASLKHSPIQSNDLISVASSVTFD